jgi:hypothetical protein
MSTYTKKAGTNECDINEHQPGKFGSRGKGRK